MSHSILVAARDVATSHTELSDSSQGTGEERGTAQTFSEENCPFL